MGRRPLNFVCLLAVAAGAASLGARQEPSFRSGADLVPVYATALDRAGQPVPNLTRDDFQVLDNGVLQPLTAFSNELQPITIVIMLDRSGSMVGNFDRVREAAGQFVSHLLPADRARIGSFSNRVRIDPAGFTSDKSELREVLRDDMQEPGATPLWNAAIAAMDALAREDGRRVVLIFTDGKDNPPLDAGQATQSEVIDRSDRDGIMPYAIGLADACGPVAPTSRVLPLPRSRTRGRNLLGMQRRGPVRPPTGPGGLPPSRPGPLPGREPPPRTGGPPILPGFPGVDRIGGRGPGRPPDHPFSPVVTPCSPDEPDPGLKQLADEGGGAYFELRETDNLAATFGRVADELHRQYLLGFTPRVLDGKRHEIEVHVTAPDVTVRARRSYIAAPPPVR